MYDKHIIVGDQSSTALTLLSLIRVRNRAQNSVNKTDTSRVSTIRRSVYQLETLCRNEPSRDTNGFAWIFQTWNVVIEYSSTYFSLQVDPGHCFHPTFFIFFYFLFFFKLNRSAKWEEAVDSNFSSSWDMRSCEYRCRLGNIWVLKMRIVLANTKPLFCRMTYSHTQDSHPVRWAGSTNTCTRSAIVH